VESKPDTSLFIYHHGDDTVYVLLYVDDIILTASLDALLRRTIASLFFPAASIWLRFWNVLAWQTASHA